MSLVKLSYLMEEINVQIGSKVISEGDKAKYVYLVKSGEFEVSKRFYTEFI